MFMLGIKHFFKVRYQQKSTVSLLELESKKFKSPQSGMGAKLIIRIYLIHKVNTDSLHAVYFRGKQAMKLYTLGLYPENLRKQTHVCKSAILQCKGSTIKVILVSHKTQNSAWPILINRRYSKDINH